MSRLIVLLAAAMGTCAPRAGAETVRLKAVADIWTSAYPGEAAHTAGRYPQLKLKTIQEMAVIRFDASPARGREVLKARLCLHRAGKDMLRYVRVSTVAADWVEGTNRQRLTAGDGASYNYADNASKRPWSFPGSQLCDVIMGSGNTLATWAERKELPGGWISVELTPALVHALVVGDTDGLAVVDGGTPTFFNNFVHSVQSEQPPYIEVELGGKLRAAPAAPLVKAEPDPGRAHMTSGAIRLTIAPVRGVFCWRLRLNGKPVPRWRVKHPAAKGPTVFSIEDLGPSKAQELEVVAVSPGGAASRPARLRVTSSPALLAPPALRKLAPPKAAQPAQAANLWAAPPLVKIDPIAGKVMFGDSAPDPRKANAVWDGKTVRLFGARGECVSFQVVVGSLSRQQPLKAKGISLRVGPLKGPGGAAIGGHQIELYRNWYARNKSKQWQPAYCVPLRGGTFDVPDPARKLKGQANQSVYVDVHVPKNAAPGRYTGEVRLARGAKTGPGRSWDARQSLPVELEVLDFALPEKLSFWPQLNSYQIPKRWHDYFRLAHNHRCVWYYRYGSGGPRVTGTGKDLKIDWEWFDRMFGPLLSGAAFKDCRRPGVPIETIALPFWDSWPTPLTPRTYRYPGPWPKRGDDAKGLVEHYMKAPHIAAGLSDEYKQGFLAAQRQFIEHFRKNRWTRTECQCVFVGKNTHRIRYGINMWWTTDEPYHWDDWLALQFFNRLWRQGRDAAGADPRRWAARADISRPQWQGRVLQGAIDNVYFGGFAAPRTIRRCRTLARENPLALRAYGSASPDNVSNTSSLVWIVSAYLNGAEAVLPWQSLGSDKALDLNDSAVGGNALICPGQRFNTGPVADMRLKALRDGQQLVEYLKIAADRCNLNREQVRAMVGRAVSLKGSVRAGAAADNADALVFGKLKAWQIAALRRALAELIARKE